MSTDCPLAVIRGWSDILQDAVFLGQRAPTITMRLGQSLFAQDFFSNSNILEKDHWKAIFFREKVWTLFTTDKIHEYGSRLRRDFPWLLEFEKEQIRYFLGAFSHFKHDPPSLIDVLLAYATLIDCEAVKRNLLKSLRHAALHITCSSLELESIHSQMSDLRRRFEKLQDITDDNHFIETYMNTDYFAIYHHCLIHFTHYQPRWYIGNSECKEWTEIRGRIRQFVRLIPPHEDSTRGENLTVSILNLGMKALTQLSAHPERTFQAEIKKLQEDKEKSQKENEKSRKERESLQNDKTKSQKEMEILHSEKMKLQEENQRLQEDKETSRKEVEKLQNDTAKSQIEVEKLQYEKQQLQDNKSKLQEEKLKSQVEKEKLQNDKTKSQKGMQELQNENEKLQSDKKKLQDDKEKLQEDKEKLQEDKEKLMKRWEGFDRTFTDMSYRHLLEMLPMARHVAIDASIEPNPKSTPEWQTFWKEAWAAAERGKIGPLNDLYLQSNKRKRSLIEEEGGRLYGVLSANIHEFEQEYDVDLRVRDRIPGLILSALKPQNFTADGDVDWEKEVARFI